MSQQRSVHVIPRSVILTQSVNEVAKMLSSQAGTLQAPLQLLVDGYNDDPRELYEIHEVRRFFKKLNKKFSGWLSPLIAPETVHLVMSCLIAEPESVVRDNKMQTRFGIKEKKWVRQVDQWCQRAPFGPDYAAHLAFEVFPNMYPERDAFGVSGECLPVKHTFEQQHLLAQQLINDREGVVKLKSLSPDRAELCLYMKDGQAYRTHSEAVTFSEAETTDEQRMMRLERALVDMLYIHKGVAV